jgi:hypothetical protein
MLAARYADRAARIERTHADATVESACQPDKIRLHTRIIERSPMRSAESAEKNWRSEADRSLEATAK